MAQKLLYDHLPNVSYHAILVISYSTLVIVSRDNGFLLNKYSRKILRRGLWKRKTQKS